MKPTTWIDVVDHLILVIFLLGGPLVFLQFIKEFRR